MREDDGVQEDGGVQGDAGLQEDSRACGSGRLEDLRQPGNCHPQNSANLLLQDNELLGDVKQDDYTGESIVTELLDAKQEECGEESLVADLFMDNDRANDNFSVDSTTSPSVMESSHQKADKTFFCKECEASFSRSHSLKRHMVIHTGEKPFSCNECGSGFSQNSHLKHHMLTHTGERPFSCHECGANFSLRKTLKKHTQTHTGDNQFGFKDNKLHVDLKQEEYTEESTVICLLEVKQEECKEEPMVKDSFLDGEPTYEDSSVNLTSSPGNKESHSTTTKSSSDVTKEQKDECSMESESTNFKNTDKIIRTNPTGKEISHYLIHMGTHDGEIKFYCEECGASFSRSHSLKRHMAVHTGEKPFSCNECGARFSQSSCLKTHMVTHTGEKPFSCKECGASFSQSHSLKRHIMVKHTREKPFSYKDDKLHVNVKQEEEYKEDSMVTCLLDIKQEDFKEESRVADSSVDLAISLENKRSHTTTTESSSDATKGQRDEGLTESYKFIESRSDVTESNCHKQHMGTQSEEKKFYCKECGASFSRGSSLKRHMVIHTGEKPFSCMYCGTGFSQNSHLKQHMLTHTGEKLFNCIECGADFKLNGHLKVHMLTHTGEKPFKCQYCGADFKLNSHLKQHMITHTGEKPFNCKECGASFKQGKQLKKHKLKHNGENLVGAMEEKIPVDVKQEEYREESMVICLVDIKQEEHT